MPLWGMGQIPYLLPHPHPLSSRLKPHAPWLRHVGILA